MQMKNRPKRHRAPVHANTSLDVFESRLRRTMSKKDFACTDGVFLAEYQFKGVHTDWDKMPDSTRARALCTVAKIAREYGFVPLGIVSQSGVWKVDPVTGDKVKHFNAEVPEGAVRLYCGRSLEIQHDVAHPLAFLPRDEVSVGGKRRRRRNAAGGDPPSVADALQAAIGMQSKATFLEGMEEEAEGEEQEPEAVFPATKRQKSRARETSTGAAATPTPLTPASARHAVLDPHMLLSAASIDVPGVEVRVCVAEDRLTEDEFSD